MNEKTFTETHSCFDVPAAVGARASDALLSALLSLARIRAANDTWQTTTITFTHRFTTKDGYESLTVKIRLSR